MRDWGGDVRSIVAADYPQLEAFVYHAIYVPPGEEYPPREVIFEPEIHVYIKGFGDMPADCGVVAELDGGIVGMAWARIIPAYGNIDECTPELAVSVLPEHRGKGIGAAMMARLFGELRERGFARTSLAVQKKNDAVRFYERLGYKTIRENDEEFIMVKELGGS